MEPTCSFRKAGTRNDAGCDRCEPRFLSGGKTKIKRMPARLVWIINCVRGLQNGTAEKLRESANTVGLVDYSSLDLPLPLTELRDFEVPAVLHLRVFP